MKEKKVNDALAQKQLETRLIEYLWTALKLHSLWLRLIFGMKSLFERLCLAPEQKKTKGKKNISFVNWDIEWANH